jgi:iron-sulfur cluster assembly protein
VPDHCRSSEVPLPFSVIRVESGNEYIDMTISITSAAQDEVKRIKISQNLGDETFLRISILGGGCSGMQYALNFDTAFDVAVDTKYDFNGVTLATQKKFDPHFDGTEIDFVDFPTGRGFVIENPNFPKFAGCAHCGH